MSFCLSFYPVLLLFSVAFPHVGGPNRVVLSADKCEGTVELRNCFGGECRCLYCYCEENIEAVADMSSVRTVRLPRLLRLIIYNNITSKSPLRHIYGKNA